jgi:predicted metalloprotease
VSAGHRTIALVVLAAVVAGGCAVGETGAGGDRSGPAAGSPAAGGPSADSQEDGTMTAAEFRRDIAGAEQLAERYWRDAVVAAGGQFRPIRRVISYDEEGEVSCGGQPLGLNNAAYCSAGDFIAYDVNWAVTAFRRIGDAFLFYLLGHEYAHGVQVRLGTRYRFTIQQELQADCMAGAYIGDSERARTLTLQDGDLDELRSGLFAVGDDPDQPWFEEGSHGTAEQRTESFFNGYERSLAACDL